MLRSHTSSNEGCKYSNIHQKLCEEFCRWMWLRDVVRSMKRNSLVGMCLNSTLMSKRLHIIFSWNWQRANWEAHFCDSKCCRFNNFRKTLPVFVLIYRCEQISRTQQIRVRSMDNRHWSASLHLAKLKFVLNTGRV